MLRHKREDSATLARRLHPAGRAALLTGAVCLLTPLALVSCSEEPPPPQEYNVILISVDTLRADRLNCYGYTERQVSPNIDALARDGVLFENHISAAPWTTPAHLSMLTALYPSAHGVTASFRDLMAQVEQDRLFNKLPGSVTTLAEILSADGLATVAFTAGLAVHPKIGFGRGFSRYTSDMVKLNVTNTGRMIHWITNHRDRPFFVFWHTFEVHAPYLQTTFVDDVLDPQTAAIVRDGMSAMAERYHREGISPQTIISFFEEHGVFTRELCDALYVGGIHSFDRWLGRLVQALRSFGMYDRTLIILTSDHGEEFGDHNPSDIYDKHGHTLYEELVRVPLIFKLPRQEHAGVRVAAVSRTVDIMPTILDVLAITADDIVMQGTSLRPLWEGRASTEGQWALSECLTAPFEQKCVRTDRYKFVVKIGAESVARDGRGHVPARVDRRELYDVVADPGEKVNLLDSARREEYAALAADLEQRLREYARMKGPAAEQVQLDQETVDKLKSLGYIRSTGD
jgi:arylsulfatase A-like enzyme